MCTYLTLNQSHENVNNKPDVDNRQVGREVKVIMMLLTGAGSNYYVASRLPFPSFLRVPASVAAPRCQCTAAAQMGEGTDWGVVG